MAKRVSKAEAKLFLSVLVVGVGLPIYGLVKFGKSVGWGYLIVGGITVVGLVVWYKVAQTNKRRAMLMAKYQDSRLVDSLMRGAFWQGQTSEQLRDSLGNPVDIDEKVLKTKKKEVWKYNHQGSNRYGLRITLDNDVVVGWEQKN